MRSLAAAAATILGVDVARAAAAPLGDALARALAGVLEQHERAQVRVPERRQAAVLIPLFERGGEPWLVLTKRTETVATHKGQISFPGGAHDPTDADLWETAVREAEEEMGLVRDRVAYLGALDDYPTFSSGFVVSPYVASIDPPSAWEPHAAEVDHVIELPLREVHRIGRTEIWERDGIRFPMHVYEIEGHYVWGVTAFILHRFLEIASPVLGVDPGTAGASD